MEIIHIVLGKANPNRMNGVNKVVFQLASEQAKKNKKVKVWGIADNQIKNFSPRLFETQLFLKRKNPFTISTKIKKAIKNTNQAVFHIHGGWIPTLWAISKYLKKHQKKIIFTPHGAYNTIAMRKNSVIKKIYFRLFEKSLLNATYKIHCIGESEKIGLELIYPNSKQYVLPYGFDIPSFKKNTIKKSDSFIIGFVGRIDIYTKGLDLLIEAFSIFSKGKKTKLWIVGDSAQMTNLTQMITSLQLNDEVRLWGSKFKEEKTELLQQMNTFVHSSRNEGLPTAVLEAASFGIPCVITEATNLKKYVVKHHAGICVSNENKLAIIQAFEKLYKKWSSNQLEQYKENTKQMLTTEFNWNNLVEKFDELYN